MGATPAVRTRLEGTFVEGSTGLRSRLLAYPKPTPLLDDRSFRVPSVVEQRAGLEAAADAGSRAQGLQLVPQEPVLEALLDQLPQRLAAGLVGDELEGRARTAAGRNG